MNSKSINRNVWALTLSLCLGVVGFSTFSAQAADPPKGTDAQQKGVEKKPPTNVEMKQPGKVLEVNNKAKTFTVMVKGKTVTVNAANLKSLPKAGDIINMGRGGADPTGQRVVCAVVECDMGWGSGPCLKCFDYGNL